MWTESYKIVYIVTANLRIWTKLIQFNKHSLNIYNRKNKAQPGMVNLFMEEITSHWISYLIRMKDRIQEGS